MTSKPIRIFRHIACEGPGYFADFLDAQGIPYEVIAIDQGAAIPERLDDVAGLAFMGGPMSVNDPLPWIAQETDLIRRAVAAGLPVLGHCLGGQLIAKALGATVGPNPVKEIGWLPVERLPNAAAQSWLDGLPARFEVFHWHGETFSIPAGASAILRSEHCAHQGFAIGNTLALQCHVEMTAAMVREWAATYPHELAAPSQTVQSAAQMQQDLAARVGALQRAAEQLYWRWLRPIRAS